MPAGSPTSDKYVVYTVDAEDSSSGLEDGQIVFRDSDITTGNDVKSMPLRSLSSDSWGSYWSKREKCCCLWNVFLILVVICLAVVFIVMHKALNDQQVDLDNSSVVQSASGHPDSVTDKQVTPSPSVPKEKICSSHDCFRLAGSILSRMNTDVDPCEDFYEYSCGGFKKMTYLTWEAPRVRENPEVLLQKYDDFLKDRLSAQEDPSLSRNENKAKSLYRSCLLQKDFDLDSIRSAIQEIVTSLNSSNMEDNESGLTKLVAMVTRNFGASPFFKVIVDRNQKISIINNYSDEVIKRLYFEGDVVANFRHLMPSDIFYRDTYNDKVMISYRSFLEQTSKFILESSETGEDINYLRNAFASVFDVEIALNKKWFNDESRNGFRSMERCGSKMNISTLQKKFPGYNISWELFFKLLLDDRYNVTGGTELCSVDLSPAVEDILKITSPITLTRYIWMHTLLHTDIYYIYANRVTPFAFSTSIYNFPKHSNGESNCICLLSNLLPLSALIAIPNLDVFEKESLLLFENLRQTLIDMVDGLYWIPRGQREAVVSHMRNITIHFEWTSWKRLLLKGIYDISRLKDDYVHSLMDVIQLKHTLYFTGAMIKPTWRMAISQFVKKFQSVELSASAIQGPSFYSPATVPVTYGSTGVIIAQTLVQAFDIDALLLHFMSGLIDRRVIFTMAHHLQCLIDTFNKYSMIDTKGTSHQVRGDLTKGLNFRDTLALHVAFRAFRKSYDRGYDRMVLPGLNITDQQVFFVSFSQTMCEKSNARGIEMHYLDVNNPKLPQNIRVHGSLSNFPKFSAAFKCAHGSPMNPDSKCIIF